MAKATYKDSGVDLDIYRESMSRLPRLLRRTHSPRVLANEGGFAGLFQLDFTDGLFARKYKDPVLVSGTDGVGTKLKVAQRAGVHNTVGIDLVGMCVNDVLCCGAEPLFFLDYVAMGQDDPALLEAIVQGISDGCVASDMALIGGETAIMPDMYQAEDYDLAGFCVGVVERAKVLDGTTISPGDVVIGVASNGVHSNGFSLVRKIVFDIAKLDVSDPCSKRLRRDSRRRAAHADDDLHAGRARRARTLQSKERGARDCAHHGRRHLRKPRSHFAAGRWRDDRSRQLADAARVHVAAEAGRRGRRRNVPRVQHGSGLGAGGQPVLRGEHSAATQHKRVSKLVDWPSRGRQPTGCLGLALSLVDLRRVISAMPPSFDRCPIQ